MVVQLISSHGRPRQREVVSNIASPGKVGTVDCVNSAAVPASVLQYGRPCAVAVSFPLFVQEASKVGLVSSENPPRYL